MRRIHIGVRTGIAFAAMTLALSPVFTLSAGASSPGNNTWVNVAGGISPANISGAVPFGPAPSNTPEEVSFILDENHASQLQNIVESGVPNENFLSVAQFAAQYGQSPANVTALTNYLGGFGIQTNVLADMIDVQAWGTAGEFDAAMSVVQDEYHSPGGQGSNSQQKVPGQTFHGPTTNPQLPNYLAKFVLSVLGLTNYSPFTSDAMSATQKVATTPSALSTNSCLALVGLPSACNTPSNFESNYGLTNLEKHNNGSGQTLAIITLATMDPGSPQYFWSKILGMTPTGRTLTEIPVDGGSGAPSNAAGSTETDLDVEQSGAIAPGANILVYEAPNTDFGFVDGFAEAASDNIASSFSSSWGEAESLINVFTAIGGETTEYQASFDEVFEEMAIQGQTGFVSAGDAGAYDDSNELGTTNLDVDSPGDSPYITTAGGTTLPWSGTFVNGSLSANVSVTSQRAWAWDYLWQPIATITGAPLAAVAEGYSVGGGGGYSGLEQTPYYQQGISGVHNYSAVPWLTPTGYSNTIPLSPTVSIILPPGFTLPLEWNFNPTPSVITGSNTGRATPDLSTDADPYSGYLEWSGSFTPTTQYGYLEGGWGGTSFVAPQLNGSAALIDSALGYRTGFWNPDLYWAASHGNSPFTSLNTASTSNDNLFYTGTPGTVFNPATGLGVPNLGQVKSLFDQ
jgi:subtilase family serine protease